MFSLRAVRAVSQLSGGVVHERRVSVQSARAAKAYTIRHSPTANNEEASVDERRRIKGYEGFMKDAITEAEDDEIL